MEKGSRIDGRRRSAACRWGWRASMLCTAWMLVVLLLFGCRGNEHVRTDAVATVDSLNALSYEYHYKSLKESERLARAALAESERLGSEDGGHEARCNIGFVQYMRMDYESAMESFGRVLSDSRNQLLKLVADVGMMRVCQRRSDNREFYVHRNSAMERMERILPELKSMTEHQRMLWNFAVSDFHLIQSIYFYYLRQEDEVRKELDAIADDMELVRSDSAQLTWFYFLGGNTKNINNQLGEDDMQNILRCVALSQQHGYVYLRSKAFTTIAEDIVNARAMKPSRLVYLRELLNVPDSLSRMELSFSLATRALKDFEEYGSLFDVSQTHIMLSEYYMHMGRNELALKELTEALACVEKVKRLSDRPSLAGNDSTAAVRLRPDAEPVDLLTADGPVHSYEMKWIQDHEPCLPEWMADVREHLSIVYAAMGMKAESDNNRNIYLDILDATRQDQRMEQHLETLKREETRLTRMMMMTGGLGLLLVAVVWGFSRRLKRKYKEHYQHEVAMAEQEMASWRARTDEDFSSLEDMEEDVNAERMGFEHRIDEQKKQYIDKTTSLSIVYSITPFLDRAVNEVRKIDVEDGRPIDALTRERLDYLMELTDRINLYNDVLTHWIKIRQGAVSLNVESFDLGSLFEVLSKRVRVFRDKHIDLQVRVTNSVVKADKALTLFMMNTLLENARKFTPEGGRVDLYADDGENYVEVSVKDTGRGLSAEDVQRILDEKVYDSSRIGDAVHDEDLRRNKGFGFGLMNCKGIIEKYRKSNPIFSVCLFSVESQLGKGSRFFFRLPKGRLRSMCIALLMLLGTLPALAGTTGETTAGNDQIVVSAESDAELLKAREFADSVYFANVDGCHEDALNYVDSACVHLNAYYLKRHPDGELLLHRYEENAMPEIALWMSGFPTDYHAILDIRNEAAIAALAMKQWDVYYYNNEIYIRLYKLLAQDRTLERYCNEIKAANINRQIVLIVVGMLLLVGLLTYFFFYYHNNILPTFNLRQIVELNRKIFTMKDESALAQMIHEGLSEIKRTDGVALLLNDGMSQFSAACSERNHLLQFMQHCMDEQHEAVYNGGKVHVFPLTTEEGDGEGEEKMIGAMAVVLHDGSQQKGERQLFQLISSHVATNIYYSQVRMERLRTQIELAEDESRRAEHEANAVHVQNMILDNCLSTIKHETMFYPNRIKQLLNSLLDDKNGEQEREELLQVKELILYYKDIFTILSNCAGRQLETVLFKRKVLPVESLVEYASRSVTRQGKKHGLHVNFEQGEGHGFMIVADKVMMEYLFDNLISFFMQYKKDGTIRLNFAKSEEFVKFALSFDGAEMTVAQFHSLFYPENLQYDAQEDTLIGAQMLVAKQIVREHDEHVRRGCRIYAEPADAVTGKGISVCFTIPSQRGRE